jgi:phosphotransferase system IIB component
VFESIKSIVKDNLSTKLSVKPLQVGDVLSVKSIDIDGKQTQITTEKSQLNIELAKVAAQALITRAQTKQLKIVIESLNPKPQIVIGDHDDPKLAAAKEQVSAKQTSRTNQTSQANQTSHSSTTSGQLQKQEISVSPKDIQILAQTAHAKPENANRASQLSPAIEKILKNIVKLVPEAQAQAIRDKVAGFVQSQSSSAMHKTYALEQSQLNKLVQIPALPSNISQHAEKLRNLLSLPMLNSNSTLSQATHQASQQIRLINTPISQIIDKLDGIVQSSQDTQKFDSAADLKRLFSQTLAQVKSSQVSLHPSLKLMIEQVQVQLVKSEAQLEIFKQLQKMQPNEKPGLVDLAKPQSLRQDKSTTMSLNQLKPSLRFDQLVEITKQSQSLVREVKQLEQFTKLIKQTPITAATADQLNRLLGLKGESQLKLADISSALKQIHNAGPQTDKANQQNHSFKTFLENTPRLDAIKTQINQIQQLRLSLLSDDASTAVKNLNQLLNASEKPSVQQIKELQNILKQADKLSNEGAIKPDLPTMKKNQSIEWLLQNSAVETQLAKLTHSALTDIDKLLTRLIVQFIAKGQVNNQGQLNAQLNQIFSSQVKVDGLTAEFSQLLGQKDPNIQAQIQQVLSQLESSNEHLKKFLNRYLPNLQGKVGLESLLKFEKELDGIQQSLKRTHEGHLQQQLNQANQTNQHLLLPLHFGAQVGDLILDIHQEQQNENSDSEDQTKAWQVNLHFDFQHIERFMMKLRMTEEETARIQIIVANPQMKDKIHNLQTLFLSRLAAMDIEVEQFHIHVNQDSIDETFRTMSQLRASA